MHFVVIICISTIILSNQFDVKKGNGTSKGNFRVQFL
ncbi:Uncharacterised protein [Flavobacterium hibernum]|nr:Uncharacterised protein [Flavobacterium hibernum]